MKKFVVLALVALSVTAFGADKVRQEKLGKVVAVQRSFKVDLDDCAKSYRFQSDSANYASCDVQLLPVSSLDVASSGGGPTQEFTAPNGKKFVAGIGYSTYSYQIQVYTNDGADLRFVSVRDALQSLIDRLPNHELQVIVHTVEKE